jgi:hypothetical protein
MQRTVVVSKDKLVELEVVVRWDYYKSVEMAMSALWELREEYTLLVHHMRALEKAFGKLPTLLIL